jgi:hypothetical protein
MHWCLSSRLLQKVKKRKESRMILNLNRSDNLYRCHLYYVVTDYFTFKEGLCFPPSKKIKIFTRNRNQIFLDMKKSIFFLRMLPKFLLKNCRVKLIMFFLLYIKILFSIKLKRKKGKKEENIFPLKSNNRSLISYILIDFFRLIHYVCYSSLWF